MRGGNVACVSALATVIQFKHWKTKADKLVQFHQRKGRYSVRRLTNLQLQAVWHGRKGPTIEACWHVQILRCVLRTTRKKSTYPKAVTKFSMEGHPWFHLQNTEKLSFRGFPCQRSRMYRDIYMYILYTDNICNYALEVFFWMMISPYFKNGGS